MLETFANHLAQSRPLSDDQVRSAVEQLIDPAVTAAVKADFLSQLAHKGETVGEISAFARALREKSIPPPLDPETRAGEILDVCGTGGDRLNTFNISTTVAIVCAAAGIAVAKHGNRAITSQAGSADVLEALGVRIDLPPADAARSLRERRFAFFFAPQYHPAFKHIAPARKLCAERGQRTIFNFLGPLLNPARPTVQIVGVPRPELCGPLAQVLRSLGVRRGMVVSGRVGAGYMDELSILEANTVTAFRPGSEFEQPVLDAREFTKQPATIADLKGGDREANAAIVRRILNGEERGPKRDAILMNAAAALSCAKPDCPFGEGWKLAAELIDSGRAYRKLEELAD